MATAPKRTKAPSAAAAGAETRERLVAAARSCLREEGMAGVSARAIARHGDLNQALVFYHYGSVDGLLQEVARTDAARRARLYESELQAVATLKDLVGVGRRIHDVEFAEGTGYDGPSLAGHGRPGKRWRPDRGGRGRRSPSPGSAGTAGRATAG